MLIAMKGPLVNKVEKAVRSEKLKKRFQGLKRQARDNTKPIAEQDRAWWLDRAILARLICATRRIKQNIHQRRNLGFGKGKPVATNI